MRKTVEVGDRQICAHPCRCVAACVPFWSSGVGAPTALLPPALRDDGPQPSRFHFSQLAFMKRLCPSLQGG